MAPGNLSFWYLWLQGSHIYTICGSRVLNRNIAGVKLTIICKSPENDNLHFEKTAFGSNNGSKIISQFSKIINYKGLLNDQIWMI